MKEKRFFNIPTLLTMTLLLLSSKLCAALPDSTALRAMAQQEEQRLQARIGIALIDTADSAQVSYRGDERFPMNSTLKSLLCAALLAQVDKKNVVLTENVQFSREQLISYSPVTEKFIKPNSMNLQTLCQAAVSHSDNTAANLIALRAGGPAAVTQFLRSIGDNVTRVDRLEPELNSAIPGDPRDTTTPLAISHTVNTLLLGNVLSSSSRQQLTQWMVEDKVADALLRAALPAGWKIADKTGAGEHGSRGIISVIWPPQRSPLLVTVYITETAATMTERNQAIARLGEKIIASLH
ncbi:MAG: Beta-lactamase [Candidatus Erwinia impunctatus]|nr:Beta-lactamase [Culicoides impunctatus]